MATGIPLTPAPATLITPPAAAVPTIASIAAASAPGAVTPAVAAISASQKTLDDNVVGKLNAGDTAGAIALITASLVTVATAGPAVSLPAAVAQAQTATAAAAPIAAPLIAAIAPVITPAQVATIAAVAPAAVASTIPITPVQAAVIAAAAPAAIATAAAGAAVVPAVAGASLTPMASPPLQGTLAVHAPYTFEQKVVHLLRQIVALLGNHPAAVTALEDVAKTVGAAISPAIGALIPAPFVANPLTPAPTLTPPSAVVATPPAAATL
jgi:hypothetical protein